MPDLLLAIHEIGHALGDAQFGARRCWIKRDQDDGKGFAAESDLWEWLDAVEAVLILFLGYGQRQAA